MRQGTVRSARGIAAFVIVCAAITSPVLAQQPTQPQPQPQEQKEQKEHVVKKGDTLWDLAGFYLSDPFQWPQIYDANRNVVRNPHWIYPRERLLIPGMKPDAVVAVLEPTVFDPGGNRSRFYVRETLDTMPTLLTSEAAAIALVQPAEWIAAPWLADSARVPLIARVFKPFDPRDQNDKLTQNFHPLDRLYISVLAPVAAGTRLLAVRLSRRVDAAGIIVEPLGILRVDSLSGNTAAATITSQFGDLKVGDVAIPMPAVPRMPTGKLTPVSGGPKGVLLDFLVDHPLYANTDYAFVSIGSAQGIAVGDELVAYLPPRKPSQTGPELLPEQSVARLQVVRVTERTATARVTHLNNTGLEAGLLVRVASKAP